MMNKTIFSFLYALTSLGLLVSSTEAAEPIPTSGKLGDNMTMNSVTANDDAEPPIATITTETESRPPLLGYSPMVVIAISDENQSQELDFEHDLHYFNVNLLTDPPPNDTYAIGLLDSGSVVDLIPEPFATDIGLSGARLTENVFPIGGASGQLDAIVSQPIAAFANGLSVIQPDNTIDTSALIGHSNVCLLQSPAVICDNSEVFRPVIGTPLLSFFTTEIKHSNVIKVDHDGDTFISPDVHMDIPYTPSSSAYPVSITMEVGGLEPVTTASYYAFPDGISGEDPIFPTLLSLSPLSIPLGGGVFFSTMGVVEGEPGPLNPLQNLRMLVDTGAQTSIISPGVAANLNLPAEPDFTVEVCGIGGLSEAVPGYYIDYAQINGTGGPLKFVNAPFVVLDLASPEGGSLDGIIGMNLFHDRDIVFNPTLIGTSFLHVSSRLNLPFGDLDRDGDVDSDDLDLFNECASGPTIVQMNPLCIEADADGDMDVDQTDFGVFQLCHSGAGNPADPTCDD